MKDIFRDKYNNRKQNPMGHIKIHRIAANIFKNSKFDAIAQESEYIIRHNYARHCHWKEKQIITTIHPIGMHIQIGKITYDTREIYNNK